VIWGFPPSRSSGVHRAVALTNAFARQGCRVTVITTDDAFYQLVTGTDDALLDAVDPAVTVRRVPFPVGIFDPVINRWPAERLTRPRRWRRRAGPGGAGPLPGPHWRWRPRLEDEVRRVLRGDPCDLVVVTGRPYAAFSAAAVADAMGVPFLLEDRDAWLLDLYTGEPWPDTEDAVSLFPGLVGAALETWFVNPPIADWHRERWPELADRIRVVENGWDPAFLDPAATVRVAGAPVRFAYVGTVQPWTPVTPLLDGWRTARGHGAMRDAVLQIHGPIGYQERHPALEKAIGEAAADGVTWFGPTSKSQLTDVYRGVDCLVYASAGGGMITASKTYEYRATGKPIVVVSEATPDALRVLADYPRTHVAADMSPAAIADALRSAARDATGDGATQRLADAQAVGARDSRDDVLADGVEHVLSRLSEQAGTS
jgi:glycosyltransferase involved in cell wall biosynthesis